jgi:16S rRNA (cytidine1402-2'-O)-methyltransferase
MPGTLFVVATPIGNLEDLTFRALRTLREVDLIAAEDTRRTAKLLAHYDIRKPTVSLREHNERRMSAKLIEDLRAGRNVALVTDAGTPGIADPGSTLVAEARSQGIPISPIPGPSAVTTALSVAGFAANQFVFMGYPPPAGTERQEWLDALASEQRVVIFFEAPHRIAKTMSELSEVDRPIVLCRELTKVHEQCVIWPNTENKTANDVGEFVGVVGPSVVVHSKETRIDTAFSLLSSLISQGRTDEATAVDMVASAMEIPASRLRRRIKKHNISVKRQTTPGP